MRVKDVQKLRKVVILRGLGYSQEEISERTDVSQQALSRWFKELKEDAEEMGVDKAYACLFWDYRHLIREPNLR